VIHSELVILENREGAEIAKKHTLQINKVLGFLKILVLIYG